MTDHLLSEPQHWRDRAVEALQRADQISDPEAKRAMQDIAAGYERLAQEAERLRATPQRHRSALDPGPRAGEKLKLADRGRQKTIPQLLASGVSVRYHRPQHSTDPRRTKFLMAISKMGTQAACCSTMRQGCVALSRSERLSSPGSISSKRASHLPHRLRDPHITARFGQGAQVRDLPRPPPVPPSRKILRTIGRVSRCQRCPNETDLSRFHKAAS
jgi:hypothetical protein